MNDYDELLNCAMDFYNLTIGDIDCRISCKTENASKKVQLAGVRLRNAIKVQQELQKLNLKDFKC